MTSGLNKLSPINVCGSVYPAPQLFHNIPMLHWILDEILNDWLRAVEPYQRQIDGAADNNARLYAELTGFDSLKPMLLKSLFSYALFFVAADNAYKGFYTKLNRAKKLSGIRLKHDKPPKKSPFIRKMITLRNIAIAHMSSEKAKPIDAFAAMDWQLMSLSSKRGDKPNLEELTFAPGRFRGFDKSGQRIQSQDLEISGLKTAHTQHCKPYLEQYDKVCCDYACALKAATTGPPAP